MGHSTTNPLAGNPVYEAQVASFEHVISELRNDRANMLEQIKLQERHLKQCSENCNMLNREVDYLLTILRTIIAQAKVQVDAVEGREGGPWVFCRCCDPYCLNPGRPGGILLHEVDCPVILADRYLEGVE